MTAHQSRTSRAIAILIRYPQSLCYLYVRDVLPDYDILPPGGTSRKYLAWAMVQIWCNSGAYASPTVSPSPKGDTTHGYHRPTPRQEWPDRLPRPSATQRRLKISVPVILLGGLKAGEPREPPVRGCDVAIKACRDG